MSRFDRIDITKVSPHPISRRKNKVSVEQFASIPRGIGSCSQFLEGLPEILAAKTLKEIVNTWVAAVLRRQSVVLMMGGHPIKCGLTPLFRELIAHKALTAVAVNGAAAIHDYEIAMIGETSEDVGQSLHKGTFGMADETGSGMMYALRQGLDQDLGFGEAVGRQILDREYAHHRMSLLAGCVEFDVPISVHVAIGTDIIHQHPQMDGASVGEMTYRDFLMFAGVVRTLCSGGLLINLGSAVMMPEVFLKALSIVRNLGCQDSEFCTVNMDMVRHYRPMNNIVKRPTSDGAVGYELVGHHEIMFPLLAYAVLEQLSSSGEH
ncbi:MAG: hypothetical protein GY847_28600 [Proteobacteria bacterium]|nr:hypothetical protein [Pseudomonadota bacterium]